jgi:high-affinity nickel-transport protein
MELSGIVLMLMLGLRHGLDPDHIAIIDGVSVRYIDTKPVMSKWAGTLFAIGHGAVITSVAVMISRFSHSWNFSKAVWDVLDWIPGLLLIFVGFLNLRQLKAAGNYRPRGWKTFFLPARLRNSSHPFAIVLTGVLFAMVFDTNTQATAWAYTATTRLSTANALLLGTAFSCVMIITDTLDSRILYILMQRSVKTNTVLNYRRNLGWIIVCLSFTMGGYKVVTHLIPGLELDESILTAVGFVFVLLMVGFYMFVLYAASKVKKNYDGH